MKDTKFNWFLIRLMTSKRGNVYKKHIIDLTKGWNPEGMDELRDRVDELSLGQVYENKDELIHKMLGYNKSEGAYIKAGTNKLFYIPMQSKIDEHTEFNEK